MKVWLSTLLGGLSLGAVATTPRSAHDYYRELLGVQGLNPLATFVCFPEDQPETFFLMGRSSQFLASLKAAHKHIDPKTKASFEKLVGSHEVLYWQGFHNGVGVDASLLPRGDTPNEWVLKFDHLGRATRQAGQVFKLLGPRSGTGYPYTLMGTPVLQTHMVIVNRFHQVAKAAPAPDDPVKWTPTRSAGCAAYLEHYALSKHDCRQFPRGSAHCAFVAAGVNTANIPA